MGRKGHSKKHGAILNENASTTVAAPEANVNLPIRQGGPVFSGDILKKLQDKIQIGMEKVNASGKVDKKGPHLQTAKEPSEIRTVGGKDKRDPAAKEKRKQAPPKSTQRISNEPRGKKRSRSGQPDEHPNLAGSNPKQAPTKALPINCASEETRKKGHQNKKSISEKDLLKEILELGGTRDDLDLVKDIDSDDDNEFIEGHIDGKGGKELRSDLEKLMAEMGYDSKTFATQQIIADDELSEEEALEDGDEGDNESPENETEDGSEKDDEDEGTDHREPPGSTLKADKTPSIPTNHTKGKLLFPPRPDWYAYTIPSFDSPNDHPSPSLIQTLHARGKELLEAENTLYSTTHLVKSSDRKFLSTIMTSGTLSDKVSALTLICQESPLHTTKTLETLLSLSKKKSRSQAIAALAAIKDLLASGLVLPSDRKLKPFAKQAGLGSSGVTDLHLLVWTFEDWLKSFYFEVLKVLEGLCSDQLEFARSHAVGYVWELLKEKPEQETNLLRLLVNKLGDSDKKVSSKVSFLLLQLQQTHPAMKSVIINAIESEVLFRPGNAAHAKYYAIITLNQTIISSRELEIANKLLDLYFAVFTGLLSNSYKSGKPEKSNISYQMTQGKNRTFNKKLSKKAKQKLEEAEKLAQSTEELNAKLISAVLAGVNRVYPFSEIDDHLFEKHVDTLFRITHSGNFNTSIQALILIHQVSASKQVVSDRFYRTLYESLLDQRLITSSKQAMYLNLLFKALKVDTNLKRVKAFVKRLVQVSSLHQPAFICGVFYLLSELESTLPSLRTMLDIPEAGDDDDEEVFRDVPDEDDPDQARHLAMEKLKRDAEGNARRLRNAYNGRKRDPEFANADKSCLWEIIPFVCHFHPSVSLYASRFLNNQPMPNKPDLSLHTLTHFLDRFVFRNPTTRKTARGHSIMQPLAGAGSETKGMVLSIRGIGKTKQSVNSEQFWTKKLEDVAPDEVFFHKYFSQRGTATKDKRKSKAQKEIENEDEDEDEGEDREEEIWSAMVGSRPELEVDDIDMDDDDMMGLGNMSGSDGNEGSEESEDGQSGESENEDEQEGGMSLDDTIAASQQKAKAIDFSEDEEDENENLAFGLDEEGSDVWASDDDISVPSDINIDVDFTSELETNTPASANLHSCKKPKKEKKGEKASGLNETKEEDEDEGKNPKKRKLKHLPTFASADDYAYLLSD